MEVILFLEIILGILCILGLIVIVIFFIRKKGDNEFNVYKLINQFNEQMKSDIETLEQGNREIDEIERKILACKKKLNMKLFDK